METLENWNLKGIRSDRSKKEEEGEEVTEGEKVKM